MPLVAHGDVLVAVAGALKLASEDDLPAWWSGIVGQAVAFAEAEVYGRLLARGFSAAQIAAWDRLEEVSRDLALFYALTRGGALDAYDLKGIAVTLDRRKELDAVLVYVKGVWVQPPAGNPGLVTTAGPASAGGIFNWPDPGDPSLGEYTDPW